MNKTWIEHSQICCLCSYKEGEEYCMAIFLKSGQKVTLRFYSEEEQKSAYEAFKPKGDQHE